MKRREILVALGGVAATPIVSFAQQSGRVYRVV